MRLLKKFSKSEFAAKMAGFFAYLYVRTVAATTRWDIRNLSAFYENIKKNNGVIFIAWHGRMSFTPYFWNKTSVLTALVSPHRDGQIAVELLKHFGIGHVSGSTNENAKRSAIQLFRELKKGSTIAIIPDGPQGPSMTMTMSPLYYAQKTGKPIMGMTYSIANSKILDRSWDKMLIPKPFNKGILAVTQPFYIPKDATAEELEKYRLEIETELNNLTWGIDKELGIPFIKKGTMPKKKRKTN